MQCTLNFVDNPLKVYEAGDNVEMTIELNVNQDFNVEEIYLKIIGIAKCEFLSKKEGKVLSGCVNYLDKKISLLNITDLTAGDHEFEANFQLPYDIPSTMDCLHGYWKKANGSISYKVELHVKSLWKPNMKFEDTFVVVSPIDLNQLSPVLHYPLRMEVFKNFTFDFTAKELFMSAMIPKRGYAPGEKILVTVNVHNQTRTRIKSVRVSFNKIMILTSQQPHVEVVQLEIVETLEYCSHVKPSSHRVFTKSLSVPNVEPNINNCELIRVAYEICVKAKASGLHRSLNVRLPVLIGTIGLDDERDERDFVRKFSFSSFETDV